MADQGLLLGIDIGTASSKGVLTRRDGTVLATATRAHQTSTPRPGWFEHDADAVWWADFRALARELAQAGPVAAVAVSGIGPCYLPADGAGRPLRPAILYGVDTRATEQISALTAELGAAPILARGGTALSSQAVGPKIRWVAELEPETHRRTELWFMASSYLVHRLTGRFVLDHHSASQCDPLYDLHAADWARDWAERVAPGLPLPELLWPTEIAGVVTEEAARETGLPPGIPVTAGTVDAWAEATSVGVSAPGDTMIMYGSTMFLIQVPADPVPAPELWTTRGVFPGTYSLAAGMATSGSITDWLRGLLGGEVGTLLDEAARVPAGSNGLLVLPYFAGERTPIFDPDARGIIAGLTLRHGRAELYRAALEGVAHGVRHNLEAMAAAGGQAERLVAVGGGAQGSLWTQIVSDVTGRAQEVPRHTMGACLGNAMLAAGALGERVDARRWNPVAATLEPDPARAEVYADSHRHYRALYPSTVDTAHFLARQQRQSGGS
ncbi:FGGY-family carbohydrate kinase [Crossiella sp. SN42]|uniref:FGGY-family carbohydrate kinase n=1 Tax=Crossiella sp. SN42 TaxID=2944808 RepID=UPI00207D401C|nr:FGGY-family carbohydrate kinase [Crossiella sp. SN42]MCO1580240.1 FGGY-family carbohydrate kinase [Crossiella sp. SN42]